MPRLALLALLLSHGFVAQAGEPPETDNIWRALPFAALMRKDLVAWNDEALNLRAEALRQRLFIDEETIALERGEDLELVVGYAAIVALVAERHGADAPGVAGATRSAAYLLHATGHAAETRADLRIAIAELGALDEPAPRALSASVRAMRVFGRERFEAAFVASAGDASATALAQAGQVALREGEPMLAAQSFMAAAAKEPLPRFAVAACEALTRVDTAAAAALCERLEARFVATFPASAGRFEEVRRAADDDSRSTQFDNGRQESSATLEVLTAEVWRRVRRGRDGPAERLAKVATERFADTAESWQLAAEVALELGRATELERVLGVAQAKGIRLGEARLAAEARIAIEALLGAGPKRKKAAGGLGAPGAFRSEIEVFAKSGGSLAVVRQLRMLAALADVAGHAVGAEEVLERAWSALVADGNDRESATLALVVALVRERWSSDAPKVLARLSGQVLADATLVVQQVELALALRARDRARVERVERQLAGDGAAVALARVVARRGREVLAGGPLDTAGLVEDRRALGALAFAFDEASPDGRRLAQARAFTLATLEARYGRDRGVERAIELLREARRFGGELAPLAGGLGQLFAGDAQGAFELCGRGGSKDVALRQALRGCQALGSAEPRPLWAEVDRLWEDANVPPVLQPGTARPLALMDFAIAVTVGDGRPLALTVRFAPVSLLVPELLPNQVEVRQRAAP